MPDPSLTAAIEKALDAAVREHFESRHQAGLCVPYEQIGETSRRIVRNQLRGVVTAAVTGIEPVCAWCETNRRKP